MSLYNNRYRIESTRLKDWDYSRAGWYFITICTKNREMMFGNISNNRMILNKKGEIVRNSWDDLVNHYSNIKLDAFIIMPNHIHGIIAITHNVKTGLKPVSTIKNKPVSVKQYTLSEIMRGFKTFSARKINQLYNRSGIPLWQPRFYDHIIRNNNDLTRIREYIRNNPNKWQNDDLHTIDNPVETGY